MRVRKVKVYQYKLKRPSVYVHTYIWAFLSAVDKAVASLDTGFLTNLLYLGYLLYLVNESNQQATLALIC